MQCPSAALMTDVTAHTHITAHLAACAVRSLAGMCPPCAFDCLPVRPLLSRSYPAPTAAAEAVVHAWTSTYGSGQMAGGAASATDAWLSTNGSGLMTGGAGLAVSPFSSCSPTFAYGQPMLASVSGCATPVESPSCVSTVVKRDIVQFAASSSSNRGSGLKLPPKEYKRACQEYRCKRCGSAARCMTPRRLNATLTG